MLILDKYTMGEKLYNLRKLSGMTQNELAEAADIGLRTYADIERGDSLNIRVETLLCICRALHITPDELLVETDSGISAREEEILARLAACSPKVKDTALQLLDVYLRSVMEVEESAEMDDGDAGEGTEE